MGGGGKNKKQTIGYKFYAGANLVLARYISRILNIKIGDKTAIEGYFDGGDIVVNQPLLFGTKAEGGVTGTFRFRKGDSLQDVDPYLASQLGATISADIGVSSLTLAAPYLGNNPYIKDIAVRAERVFELEDGVEQWYVEKAGIGTGDITPVGVSYSAVSVTDLFKYKNIVTSDATDYSNPAYDDSSWPELPGSFGGSTPFNQPPNNALPVGTVIADNLGRTWLRKQIIVSQYCQLSFNTYHDNHGFLWVNGVSVPITNSVPQGWAGTATAIVPPGIVDIALLTIDDIPNPITSSGMSVIAQPVKFSVFDINPVHIIREALINTEWGYGYNEADIDDANFRAVADTLYAENFGLSYFWDDDTTLDAVINKVLDHVDGVLYLDRDTLKFKIGLNRSDYDPDELIELRASIEVSRIDNYKKPQFLDLVNTVTVNYYNTVNGGSGSLSASNSALFLQQGVRKSAEVDYTMCCNAALAARLLQRELDIQTNPFSSCDVYANSAAKTLRRGSVFKLTAPDYNYNQTIMRVTEISYGDGKSKAIKISCVEDRFAMPSDSSVAIQEPEVPVVGNPVPLTKRLLIEEPYAFLVERLGQTSVDDALDQSPESGYYGSAAKREGNALVCDIYNDDGAGYEFVGRLDFCPYGELQAGISYLDSSFTLENLSDIDSLEGEVLFQIDDEIMALGSIDGSTGAITGALRGCFDTIPAEHAAGAKVFFIGAWLDGADKEYVDGETINVKLVPTNSAGTLPLASAPVDSLTFVSRALRPYAPGLFKIGGTAYPATVTGAFNVTWAHRDRKAQADQIVDTLQPSLALPDNQRYGLRFEKVSDNSLLVERTDIGAATASVTLNYTGDVRCKLWTIDNNNVSLQTHTFEFGYTPPGGTPVNQITATAYTPVDDSTIIDGGGD